MITQDIDAAILKQISVGKPIVRFGKKWVTIVGDHRAIDHIRRSGVQQDPMMSSRSQVVVPEFVGDAVRTFVANEGFGDMQLSEYLNRMWGEHKAKAK